MSLLVGVSWGSGRLIPSVGVLIRVSPSLIWIFRDIKLQTLLHLKRFRV